MTLDAADYKYFALSILPAAQKAGAAILDVYGSAADVRYKADHSPVTDADNAAEDILLAALAALMPTIPVIAEEQAAAGKIPDIGKDFFLVDPLDGTKEFLKSSGEFTINVALVAGDRPIFGLVYAPQMADCYLTLDQAAAVRFELHPSHHPSRRQQWDFSPLNGEASAGRPMTATVSRSNLRPGTQEFLEKLGTHQRLRMGSSLKFGVLARGDADVYPRFGPTSEWDTAAGHAILNAAGGCVVTSDGKPLLYGKKHGGFLNPAFGAWRRPCEAIMSYSPPGREQKHGGQAKI